MSFQPPVIWSLSNTTGYALQLNAPHPFLQAILNSTGECYVQPILSKPTGAAFTVTDSVSNVAASGAAGTARTFTPSSMTNIKLGMMLTLDKGLPTVEQVLVTAVTGSTFSCICANAHNGVGVAITIDGTIFIAAPSASPAPAAGAPAQGWWHMLTNGTKRSSGIEPAPVAGSPLFGAGDLAYGVLIWCVSACEIEIAAH